jgi:flagellar basal body-associated protein FliL
MKKSFITPLITIIILVLLGAMFVYFYVTLNRLEKKITTVQTAIADDSGKISAIVNFFNANTNAQTNK